MKRWTLDRERGQALAEFALVLPMFALLLFALIDMSRFVFTANAINNGAREAARFATVSVRPASCTGLTRAACAQLVAQTNTWGVPASSLTVAVACERIAPNGTRSSIAVTSCRTNDLLVITSQTEFTLVTPLIAQLLGDQTITGESRVTVNQ
jgi:Flp pilus assembly protein TadG